MGRTGGLVAVLLLALAGCSGPPAASPAPKPPATRAAMAGEALLIPGRLYDWSGKAGEPRLHRIDDVTVETWALPDTGVGLAIHAPGMETWRLEAPDVAVFASFGVGRIDPKRPRQVLLNVFTNGLHCCSAWLLLVPEGRRWKAVKLGEYERGPTEWPTDADGDGTADFVAEDMTFYYRFASYTGSRAPPRIYNVADGRRIDVSDRPGFRPLFERDLQANEADCRAGEGGPCAAFVADAVRLGRRGWALDVVRKARPRHSGRADFEADLTAFLAGQGYPVR